MRNPKPDPRRRGVLKRAGAVVATTALLAGVPAMSAVAAETGTIAVCVTDSTGTNIALASSGNTAIYQVHPVGQTTGGSTNFVGPVGESGCREQTVPAGRNVTVFANYQGTTSKRTTVENVPAGVTTKVDFYTTKVTVNFPGALAYGGAQGNSAHWGSSPRELLSDGVNPTMFRATLGGKVMRTPILWPAANSTGKTHVVTLASVQVLDGTGVGLPNVTVQYNTSGGNTLYWVRDTDGNLRRTGPDGLLVYPISGNVANITQRVAINNTSARDTFPAASTTVPTFQTTRLAVNYNHLVQYRQGGTPEADQTHYWLTKSGMELFPGSYSLQFQVPSKTLGNADVAYPGLTLDLAPGVVTKTAAAVRLSDSSGKGLLDGTVRYWRNSSWNYPAAGATDGPKGTWVTLLDGAPGNITFGMTYEGAYQQLASQNLATSSVAYFKTVPAVVQVIDHAGNPLEGSQVTFFGTNWRAMGDTGVDGKTAPRELLPVRHSFRAYVNGSNAVTTINNVSATPVVFQTGRITSTDGWITHYYTNAWRTFPAGGVELLPSNVTLRPTTGGFVTNAEAGVIKDFSVG